MSNGWCYNSLPTQTHKLASNNHARELQHSYKPVKMMVDEPEYNASRYIGQPNNTANLLVVNYTTP